MWKPVTFRCHGVLMCVYPPFRSGDRTNLTPDFAMSSSPAFSRRRIKIPEEYEPLAGMRVLPVCRSSDPNRESPPQIELNSFQVDAWTSSERVAEKCIQQVVGNGVTQLRRQSGQFWIGQFAGYFESYKKVHYQVDEGYNITNSPWSSGSVYSGSPRTIVVDEELWTFSWKRSVREQLPDEIDTLQLAEHQVAQGDLFYASITLGLAVEKCKYRLWDAVFERGLCSRSQHKAAQNDTKKPIRYFEDEIKEVGLKGLALGADTRSAISEIWVARGIIAHGKERELKSAFPEGLNGKRLSRWVDCVYDLRYEIDKYVLTL